MESDVISGNGRCRGGRQMEKMREGQTMRLLLVTPRKCSETLFDREIQTFFPKKVPTWQVDQRKNKWERYKEQQEHEENTRNVRRTRNRQEVIHTHFPQRVGLRNNLLKLFIKKRNGFSFLLTMFIS